MHSVLLCIPQALHHFSELGNDPCADSVLWAYKKTSRDYTIGTLESNYWLAKGEKSSFEHHFGQGPLTLDLGKQRYEHFFVPEKEVQI
jgi:hypothetical protein